MDEATARDTVVATARMMSRAGLAGAFGHVSVRCGGGFVITSTLPFAIASAEEAIPVADLRQLPEAGAGVPLETPMHAAVYQARPDVDAICRGHPPAAVAWGVGTEELPLLHGLGALAGVTVAVHPDVDLIGTASQGAAVAETLGAASGVLLQANGCLCVGATPLEAVTRLFFLEERARVAIEARHSREGVDWESRLRFTDAELSRAMAWMEATFGEFGSPGSPARAGNA